jgi:hypothetical protein
MKKHVLKRVQADLKEKDMKRAKVVAKVKAEHKKELAKEKAMKKKAAAALKKQEKKINKAVKKKVRGRGGQSCSAGATLVHFPRMYMYRSRSSRRT